MSSIREFLSARDEYITRVKEELLGPGSEISIPDSEHGNNDSGEASEL